MSQEEVLFFLEKNKDKWFSVKEISKPLGIQIYSCYMNLRRLKNFIKKKEIIKGKNKSKIYIYSWDGK